MCSPLSLPTATLRTPKSERTWRQALTASAYAPSFRPPLGNLQRSYTPVTRNSTCRLTGSRTISRMTNFVAAVLRSCPVVFNRDHTLLKVRNLPKDVARQGAKLVIFREALISSYPKGLGFADIMLGGNEKPMSPSC